MVAITFMKEKSIFQIQTIEKFYLQEGNDFKEGAHLLRFDQALHPLRIVPALSGAAAANCRNEFPPKPTQKIPLIDRAIHCQTFRFPLERQEQKIDMSADINGTRPNKINRIEDFGTDLKGREAPLKRYIHNQS